MDAVTDEASSGLFMLTVSHAPTGLCVCIPARVSCLIYVVCVVLSTQSPLFTRSGCGRGGWDESHGKELNCRRREVLTSRILFIFTNNILSYIPISN